jgi:hypothetical protein
MIHDLTHLLARTARLGVLINLAIPAAVALLAYGLRSGADVGTEASSVAGPSLMFLVLVGLAVMELIGAFLLRRRFLSAERVRTIRHDPALVEQWLTRSAMLIFALGASPMVYGAGLYLWSGDLRHLAFFGIITLLAYRLFRPTEDLLSELLDVSDS